MIVLREAEGDKPQVVYIGDMSMDQAREPADLVHPSTGEAMTELDVAAYLEWRDHRGRLLTNTNGFSSEAVHIHNQQVRKTGEGVMMMSLISLRPTPEQLQTFAEQYPPLYVVID